MKDILKQITKAFPAANANSTSDAIDLEQLKGGALDNIVVELAIPATTALVEGKTATFKVYDSADGSEFAAIDPLISTTVVGASGNGSAAKTVAFRLPVNARRYIAVNCAVENAGGDNTAKSYTLSLLA